MTFTDGQRFAHGPDVVATVLDGEAVLLDLATGKYLGLNHVATRIWESIGAGSAQGEIRAVLLDEFDAEPATIDQDLADMLATLLQRNLILAV